MASDALALDRKNILAKNATSPARSEAFRLPPDDASTDLAKTLTMEFVYVVPREEIFPDFYPQGLVRFGSDFTEEGFLASVFAHGYFVERKHAERTPSLTRDCTTSSPSGSAAMSIPRMIAGLNRTAWM